MPTSWPFNPEALSARDHARGFAERYIRPAASDYQGSRAYPRDLERRMADAGYFGGVIPEANGGSGMAYESLVTVVEELAVVDHFLAGQIAQPSGVLGAGILRYGTDAQRERYLRPLCRAETHGSVAMTEPSGGSDVAGIQTTATAKGDTYVLRGEKTFVSHVDIADFFLVFAKTDPSAGKRGISVFIVDAGSDGLAVLPIGEALPSPLHSWGQVFFDDVVADRSAMVGEPGEGLRVAMSALDTGRVVVAARCCGAARRCLDAAVEQARERVVSGSAIGRYQLVQAKIATMATHLEAARLLTYAAARAHDEGAPTRLAASMAKIAATEMFEEVARETVQIFGGAGMSNDYPWVQYLVDARSMQIAEGTSEIQKVIIAEVMLGYRSVGQPLRVV